MAEVKVCEIKDAVGRVENNVRNRLAEADFLIPVGEGEMHGFIYDDSDTGRATTTVLVRSCHGVGGGGGRTDGDGGGSCIGAPSVAACTGGGERGGGSFANWTVSADGGVYGVAGGLEAPLCAIRCTCAVGGVGPHVVGGIRCKAGYAAGERPRAAAVTCVAIGNGRVLAGAPANAAGSHSSTAVVGYVATASGGSGRDVGNGVCGDGAVHRHGDAPGAGAAVSVGASHGIGGGRCRVDGDGGSGGTGVPAVTACTGSGERSALSGVESSSAANADCHGVAGCGETLLRAVGGPHTVSGVGSHVVGGVWCKAGDAAGERPRAAAITCVAIGNGRVLAGAPAYAACGHSSAAVGGYVAAAGGGSG